VRASRRRTSRAAATEELQIDVSIIIAARGRWDALTASLESALSQSGCSLEVIVVAEGSPPPDVERAPADERVTIAAWPEGRGEAAARNLGVRRARGRWLSFLEPGDLWAPHHLATLVEAGERADAEFAYCATWLVHPDLRIRSFCPAPSPDALERVLLEQNALRISGVVARRELFARAGGFDEWLTRLADWDLWIRWSRIARACMVPTATIAAVDRADAREASDELRELARRYGRDARRAGVRFGSGQTRRDDDEPPVDARPPWLAEVRASH
jgi:glycosyltransferase involved in cell wall biosynthesis